LSKVKNRVKASKIFEKQSMDGMAKSLGYWELQGGYEKEDEFLRRLDAVTSDDLRPGRVQIPESLPSDPHPLPPERRPLAFRGVRLAREDGSRLAGLAGARWKSRNAVQPPSSKVRDPGGGTLLVKERHGLPVVSLGVFFEGGFPDEGPRQFGLTTLMTKCLLKGSGSMDHARFAESLEVLAARLDTVAEKDYWGITLDVLAPQFDEALSLAAQSLTRPTFDPLEVRKERDLQRALIDRLSDDPGEYGLLRSDVLTFQGTPYAHTLLGEAKTVSRWDERVVRSWYRSRVGRKGLTVVAVGDVDPDALRKKLAEHFATLPPGPSAQARKRISPRFKAQESRETMDRRQSTVVLGLAAPAFEEKDYFTLRVVSALLNGMGARLFVELREKKSLAYSVFASHEALSRSGIFQAYIGCAPQKEAQAREGLLQVLRSLGEEKVSEKELDRAKTYITGLYQVGLQSNRSQMASLARYEMTGPGAEWVARYPDLIARVTAKDIQDVARRLFKTEAMTWVVLGPADKSAATP
jgi:zinc protease